MAFSELPLASFSKRVLVPSLSYENEIYIHVQYFRNEWLYTGLTLIGRLTATQK